MPLPPFAHFAPHPYGPMNPMLALANGLYGNGGAHRGGGGGHNRGGAGGGMRHGAMGRGYDNGNWCKYQLSLLRTLHLYLVLVSLS
jgi:hypothetical protein